MVHSVLQSELQPEVEAFVPFKRPLVRGTQGRYRPPGKYLMPLQRHASSRAPHSTRALCLPCPATRGSRPWPFIIGRHTASRTQRISSLLGFQADWFSRLLGFQLLAGSRVQGHRPWLGCVAATNATLRTNNQTPTNNQSMNVSALGRRDHGFHGHGPSREQENTVFFRKRRSHLSPSPEE